MSPSGIQPIAPGRIPSSIERLRPAQKNAGNFVDLVRDFAKEVEESQNEASSAVARLAAGKTDNVHQVMLSLGKAEVNFNYMMEIRNRLVEAYKEVMRMQI